MRGKGDHRKVETVVLVAIGLGSILLPLLIWLLGG